MPKRPETWGTLKFPTCKNLWLRFEFMTVPKGKHPSPFKRVLEKTERRVGTLLQRELKEGGRARMEELKTQAAKHEEEKAVWEKELDEWASERKRLGSWKEHINGFNKGLRQATFFYKVVDAIDSKYNVNKDVIDGRLVDEEDLSTE
ncbi:hypothetical protein DEO72_LG6g1422 [Vigna unguiculata]|uniref:Uncharacterized protein n=1 Tax=Vigna unguiculata TaxID=3917 RepID=A0A4D6MA59_VIGUN|nr:hypothetical protein DEO72_LG6g1422 [Vigna unguiculata]